MSEQVPNLDRIERSKLVTRGRRLEYFTIAYNSLEGLIAVVAGHAFSIIRSWGRPFTNDY
jgi:hypothetical protein